MQLNFFIEGEKQLSRSLRLKEIGEQVQNWRPAFELTARLMKKEFAETAFSTEGASLGKAWDPLSPDYARWKAKHYPGKGILVRTGKMQRSFQTRSGAFEAEIWNPTAYFKYHQSNAARSKLPRRMMMYLTNPIKAKIVKFFHTYWQATVRGNASLPSSL